MPRLPRIHLEGAIFLISCNGQDGETIFKDKADSHMYLELVNRYKNQYRFRLYAYALLPERLHLLVEPGDDSTISQIMHDLNSAYTKYFNARNGRRGHLFESRFKSSLVEKAAHLVEATRHVHRQAVDGAVSSLDLYVMCEEGKEVSSPVTMQDEIREALEFLKNRDDRAQYRRYVVETPAAGESADLEKAFRRSAVIGSPEFVERVQNRIKEQAEIRRETPAAPAGPNRLILFMLGTIVVLATATSIYLYVSRQRVEAQYEALIRQMETRVSGDVLSDQAQPGPAPKEGGA